MLNIKVFDGVYEPREDSYFLASVAKDLKGSVLEIGVGTGIVCLHASLNNNYIEGVDINPIAVKNARYNAKINGIKGVFYVSDMFERIEGQFDYILFNPPYLPEEGQKDIALDGGKDGNKLIDVFIKEYKQYLSEKGKAYLLASSINKLDERYGLSPIKELSLFFEKLYIYELR